MPKSSSVVQGVKTSRQQHANIVTTPYNANRPLIDNLINVSNHILNHSANMPPRPSLTSASSASKHTSSSASSTLESPTDDPKTLELREFAITALESFEMQAILSFTKDQSLARTRHQLLKRLVGIPSDESPTSSREQGSMSATGGFEGTDDDGYGENGFRSSRGSRR
ncbi:hypothetical protein TWF788_008434 [Orbilia oligospora]|uniref:Uncharacterized protein n=1 Tax=Orbilia oligospora TaxID=2813651 RepID=A0A7C8KY28_ORBOL|nr:hypothetical protein TWF788_008434 [Orbilia oligospora]